jgi:hypothetical protein
LLNEYAGLVTEAKVHERARDTDLRHPATLAQVANDKAAAVERSIAISLMR